MDQMQTSVMQLIQAVTTLPAQQKPKAESSDKSEFRDLMKQQSQTDRKKTEQPEAAPKDQPAKEDEVDAEALQQLAAMQLFCADATQIVVPAETAAPQEVQAIASPLAQQTAVEAGGETAVQQLPQEQKVVEAPVMEGGPAVETAEKPTVVKAPEAAEGQTDQLRQETAQKQAPTAETGKAADKVEITQAEAQPEKVFDQVDTAPVKVSEARNQGTEVKSVPKQVAEQVTQALQKGETRVEVQLTPQHLGKITVELTQKGDGSLHIALHAENSQTRALLERELPAMQTVLSRDTQQTVEVQVPRREDAQQNAFDQAQHQHPQQEQEQKQQRQSSNDFLDQLRLGLVPDSEDGLTERT